MPKTPKHFFLSGRNKHSRDVNGPGPILDALCGARHRRRNERHIAFARPHTQRQLPVPNLSISPASRRLCSDSAAARLLPATAAASASPPLTGFLRPRTAAPAAAAGTLKLRKPVFTTVDQLKPPKHGHNLTARVLSAKTILENPSPSQAPRRAQVAECIVGDHAGTVLFTARNQQRY